VRGTACAPFAGTLNGFVEGVGFMSSSRSTPVGRYAASCGPAKAGGSRYGRPASDRRERRCEVSVAYQAIETERQRIQLAETGRWLKPRKFCG